MTPDQYQPLRSVLDRPALEFFHKVTDWIVGILTHHRFAIGCGIITLSSLVFIPAFNAGIQGDPVIYRGVANDLLKGVLPYRDRVLEYPPYSIPLFAFPRIFGVDAYFLTFMGMAFLADWAIKMLLLLLGIGRSTTARGLLPVLCYCLAVPFIHFFYLQRYDVWLAVICLAGVWLFSSRRYFLGGLAMALGIGLKVYPAVFVPPLLVLAVRQEKGRRFAAGLATGLLPIVLLSLALPWWRFAQFQGARGLQCESLYASVLWLGRLLGMPGVKWAAARAWQEVQGPSAVAVLPWARSLFFSSVCVSSGLAIWAAVRMEMPSAAKIARLLLIPLLAFIAFNVVPEPSIYDLASASCRTRQPGGESVAHACHSTGDHADSHLFSLSPVQYRIESSGNCHPTAAKPHVDCRVGSAHRGFDPGLAEEAEVRDDRIASIPAIREFGFASNM